MWVRIKEQQGSWVGQRQSIDTDISDHFRLSIQHFVPIHILVPLPHVCTHARPSSAPFKPPPPFFPSSPTNPHVSSIPSMAMELQLGLALFPTNPTKPFHLNTHHRALPCLDFDSISGKKRPLDIDPSSAFRRTLPLLLWNDHPNDGDDDPNDPNSASSNHPDNPKEQEIELVGWPPLKKRRKTLFVQKRIRRAVVIRRPVMENGGGVHRELNSNNSLYVKVKMEGVGIGRKVDIRQHHCFDALRATLMNMFDKPDSDGYNLTYQDTDGDWLLADDVTWRDFIRTVQRIKLEKNGG